MVKERELYPDILRIIACFMVIVIHVSGSWAVPNENFSYDLLFFLFYNGISSVAVPLFVMISGMFMLNSKKETNIKDLFKKNILKLAIIYVFWSLFYGIYRWFIYSKGEFNLDAIKYLINRLFTTEYHLWFLPMIIGLYLLIPILKEIVKNKKITEYFIILYIAIMIIATNISYFPYFNKMAPLINNIKLGSILGYTGYFVIGYYLHEYGIKSNKVKNIIYGITIILLPIVLVYSTYISVKNHTFYGDCFNNFSIFTLLSGVSLILLFKDFFKKHKLNEKLLSFIYKLSKNTLGIYLIHMLFIIICSQIDISPLDWNPLFSIPIMSIMIFICSSIITLIISKIPFLNKYLI